jgi:hypothetical protein
MAVRRSALDGVRYPEDMGPGTRLPVGDEGGLLAQVSSPEAANRIYVASAVVAHDVKVDNVTFGAALQRSYAQGMAQARVRIAVVPPETGGPRPSLIRLVLTRIRASTSLREFLCTCARHAGYLRESRRR